MKPSAAAVRRFRPSGWADFKHKLCRAGILPSPTAEVPPAWQQAFLKAFRKDQK